MVISLLIMSEDTFQVDIVSKELANIELLNFMAMR
jgi:hypothetical protein